MLSNTFFDSLSSFTHYGKVAGKFKNNPISDSAIDNLISHNF